MNQISEGNTLNINCSQPCKNRKNRNKKAQHPTKTIDELNIINQEQLSEVLKSLHINKVNSNLPNGTSNHTRDEPTIHLYQTETEDVNYSEVAEIVNNVECNEGESIWMGQAAGSVQNSVEYRLDNNDVSSNQEQEDEIEIISYESELQMPAIMRLIQKDLSEPYSIYTYRYFIHNWPKLCFLAMHEGKCIGAIVCKLDMHRNIVKRGYIAMLAVDEKYRKKKIGSRLVQKAIQVMIADNADEVVLETEITNKPALKLYENLGFVRDKRLFRYYLNGVDALRLKLWLR